MSGVMSRSEFPIVVFDFSELLWSSRVAYVIHGCLGHSMHDVLLRCHWWSTHSWFDFYQTDQWRYYSNWDGFPWQRGLQDCAYACISIHWYRAVVSS